MDNEYEFYKHLFCRKEIIYINKKFIPFNNKK